MSFTPYNGPRPSAISSHMLKKGSIVFLKYYEDVDPEILRKYDLEPNIFKHPILVLRSVPDTQAVVVCMLTTFGDCRLEDRHRRSKWDDFIAIHPRSPPAPAFPQLHLENERQLRKAGYINVTKQLTVDAGMLEPYSWLSPPNAYRLTAESFAIVAARFNIEIINPTLEQRQLITETKFRMLEPKRRTLKHLGGADQAHPVPPVRYCEPPRPDTSDSLDKQSTKQTTRKGFVTLLWQILVSLLFLTVSYVRPHLLRIILSIGVTISVAIVRATWTLLRGAVGMMNFIVGADFLIFG